VSLSLVDGCEEELCCSKCQAATCCGAKKHKISKKVIRMNRVGKNVVIIEGILVGFLTRVEIAIERVLCSLKIHRM